MDARLYRGGSADLEFPSCDGASTYSPPFGLQNNEDTPPFDAHVDGAYNLGDFSLGMPYNPKRMPWQRTEMERANPKVGDIVRMLIIPANHYVDYIRFDVARPDPKLAGATVSLTAQRLTWDDTNGEWLYTEISDVADAAEAQGVTTIALDTRFSAMISTLTAPINGIPGRPGVGANDPVPAIPAVPAYSSYIRPLYANPGETILLGLKIESLPTDTDVKLQDATNDWYLTCRVHGFESPAYY